jgi:ribose 5-phosphate isomerase B
MIEMRIAFGSDHAGFQLKQDLAAHARALGHEVTDVGTHSTDSVDYPTFAFLVAESVARGAHDLGVLVCGSGLGMSIAANKVPGVRAAVCQETYTARMAREHNDANVLCLGQRVVGIGLATDILDTFLRTPFSQGANHRRRLDEIAHYEQASREPDVARGEP